MATIAQNALTVIADVKPGERAALNDKLTEFGRDPDGNAELPLGKIPTLHFSCFVILNEDPPYPPSLVLESNYDGGLEPHLSRWTDVGLEGLRAIFSHCVGFPGNATADQVKAYMRQHSAPSAAFYVGCQGQTVEGLRNAIAVREEIQGFLDAEQADGALDGLSARQILERIQAHLLEPDVVSPQVSSETLTQLRRRSRRNLILLALVGIPIVLFLLPLVLLWILLLRLREYRDNHAPPLPPLPIDPRPFEHPDIHAQSHLTTMVTLRSGPLRAFTVKLALAVTSLLAKTVSIAGDLLGIPTIHFARWVMMDNGKRMLFFSNFDGSWARYLGDFVDKAKLGLTAIWGNTDRFPPSRWLAFGGAAEITPFKQWSREHNVYAPIFYRAYPSATIANLLNDIEIRDNVGRSMSETEAADFLQAF